MTTIQCSRKIRRRKPFLKIFLPQLSVIFLVLVCTAIFNLYAIEANSQAKFERYTVTPGDTLWSIAERRCGAEKDPRQYIYEVKKINSLDSANIQVGQVLELPEE